MADDCFRQVAESRKPGSFTAEVHTTDGEVRTFEARIAPLLDQGEATALILNARDITDRKRLEEKNRHHADELKTLVEERAGCIRELERQRAEIAELAVAGRMTPGVAHEINNPLAGIKNSFLLIRDAVPAEHPHHEYVGLIDREIDRLCDIVLQMYQLHLPDGRVPVPLDIVRCLRDVSILLETRIRRRQLILRVEADPGLPRILAPEGEVKQVLLNILENAVQASPEGAEIAVVIARDEGGLRVSVTDQGEGISAEVLPHIFDPFFTTKRAGTERGMGLGLSVSRSLINAMAGRIDVQTEVGRGTTFSVLIPESPATRGPIAPRSGENDE